MDLDRKLESLIEAVYKEVAGSNPKKALRLSQEGISLARRQKKTSMMARLLLGRAHAYREIGETDRALQDYDHSARLFARLGEKTERWRTAIGKMDALDQKGRYKEALRLARAAARYFHRTGLSVWEGKIHANTGNVYQHLDRYDLALKYYKKAYRLLVEERPLDAHILLFNQATTYLSSGKPEEAIHLLLQCQQFFDAQKLASFSGRTNYNLAYGYYLLGKYEEALDHLSTAMERLRRLGDPAFLASCYLDQVELFLRLNQVSESIRAARMARKKFQKLKMPYELAEANALTGIALLKAGKVSPALGPLKEARTFFQRHRNAIKSAELDSHIALALLKQNRPEEARKRLLRARTVFQNQKLYSRALSCTTYLASLELHQENLTRAETLLRQVQKFLPRVRLPWVLLSYYQLLGKIQASLNRNKAEATLLKAIGYIESLRSEVPGEELRISYFEDKLVSFHTLIEMYLQRGDLEGAFQLTERARSRVLHDLLAGSPGYSQEESWREPFRLAGGRRRAPAEPLQHREDQNPPVPLSRLQAALLSHQAVLSYYSISNTLHAFVVTRQKVKSFCLGDIGPLFRDWQLFRFHLERGRYDDRGSLPWCELYQKSFGEKLIGPLYEHLREYPHWIVLPHGWLHALPFHSLMWEEQSLCDRHILTYAPSASVYLHCRCLPPISNKKSLILGYADVYAPLIEKEVREIKDLFPGEVTSLVGDGATSAPLRDSRGGWQWIHIAGHGRFLLQKPMLSGILLADGWLSVNQIYGLNLRADLITLSGCETGTSRIESGDELLGLIRGLLYAGASLLQVSLWRVTDESTSYFMHCFYSHLVSNLDYCAAWQQAILQTRKKWPHPYHWAPFILIGAAG